MILKLTSMRWSYSNYDMVIELQPIAGRMAQNLEILSKNFQFSTRRTRILMGLSLVLFVRWY